MRKLALLAILLTLPLVGQSKQSWAVNGGWEPRSDKAMHFLAGSMVGVAPYFVAKKLGYKHPWVHSLAWAILAGIWKEQYDKKHGGRPDYADAAYTGLGGFTIGWAIHMGDKKKQEFATAPKAPE